MSADLARHLSRFDLSEAAVMAVPLPLARRSMIPYRVAAGFEAVSISPREFTTNPADNLKLSHSETDMVAAYGLSLAPADTSRWKVSYWMVLDGRISTAFFLRIMNGWNTCRYATPGCRRACLFTSGNGRYTSTQMGKVWKTWWLASEPLSFLRYLVEAIDTIDVDAWKTAGFTVSFRFNVVSDLPFEQLGLGWLIERIQARGIRLYDYTKWPTSRRPGTAGYTLCQSAHEKTTAAQIRRAPHPVVVVDVPRGRALPATYLGRPVVDGDVSDARFLDPAGSVVLLRFKNVSTTDRAAAVASGFVKVAS